MRLLSRELKKKKKHSSPSLQSYSTLKTQPLQFDSKSGQLQYMKFKMWI